MHLKKHLYLFAIPMVFLLSCNTDNAQSEQESYEDTREKLLQTEQKNPVNFLTASNNEKKNLLGQTVIKGKITNKATLAIYKDIDIKLFFYSKTNTLLETDTETIFEVLNPGQTKEFKTKYFAPKGTDSVSIQILGAKLNE